MSKSDDEQSMQYIQELAGNAAGSTETALALERTQILLAMVARVWEVPAADVPPAATYSASWGSEDE